MTKTQRIQITILARQIRSAAALTQNHKIEGMAAKIERIIWEDEAREFDAFDVQVAAALGDIELKASDTQQTAKTGKKPRTWKKLFSL